MHLKDLKYVVVIAEEGSISRAAERLFMAQSSLSQFLQQLEAELGCSLFYRTSQGVQLTTAGQIYVQNARQILTHYRHTQDELWDMAKLQGGKVIMGISTFRGQYMLPPVLKLFYQQYPKVHVDIVEENSIALEELILEGRLDLALVALPLSRLKQKVESLCRDEILLVTNRFHPVMEHVKEGNGGRGYVELEHTASYEWILSDYNTILGSMGRKEFKKRGLEPLAYNTNITAPFAAAMARQGLGLAFTYRSCAEEYPGVEYLSIGKEGIFLELGLAYPVSDYRSKAARTLSRLFHEHFSALE